MELYEPEDLEAIVLRSAGLLDIGCSGMGEIGDAEERQAGTESSARKRAIRKIA